MSKKNTTKANNLTATWLKIPRVWRYVIVLFVTVKIAFAIMGIFSLDILQPTESALPPSPFRASEDATRNDISGYSFIKEWFSWDGLIYQRLAHTSYVQKVNHSSLQTLAQDPGTNRFSFPPLYPLLGKVVGKLLGGHYALALLLISNAALVGVLYYAVKLGQILLGSEEAGERFAKYLMLLPAAFLFQAAMTEALFLFLVLGAFYYAEKDKWWLSAIFGFFAALTRSTGFLIALPLLLVLLQHQGYRLHARQLLAYVKRGAWLLLVPLGWLLFMAYSKVFTGDWMAYDHLQQFSWGITLHDPLVTWWQGFSDDAFIALRAWVALGFAGLVAFGYKVIRLPYFIYSVLFILIPLSLGPVQSFTSLIRYLMVVFPAALVLARLAGKKDLDTSLTIGLALLQGVIFVLWSNYWTTFII